MGIRSGIKRGVTAAANKPLSKLFSSHYNAAGKMTTKGKIATTKKFIGKHKGKGVAAVAGASAGVGVGGYYAYRKSRTAGKK